MTKKERLRGLIDYYSGGNKAKFARMLGISPQSLNAWLNRDTFDIELVSTKCVEVSRDWLLTGEGDMLRGSENLPNPLAGIAGLEPATAAEGIPFYGDLPVTAGESGDVLAYAKPTAYYKIPHVRAEYIFPVIGCSMQPEIIPGDVIAVYQIYDISEFDPERVYMVITRTGDRMIKRLHYSTARPDVITAHSTNASFAPITLMPEDILHVFRVTFVGRYL